MARRSPFERLGLADPLAEFARGGRGGLWVKVFVRAVDYPALREAGAVTGDVGVAGFAALTRDTQLEIEQRIGDRIMNVAAQDVFCVQEPPLLLCFLRMNQRQFSIVDLETIRENVTRGLEGRPEFEVSQVGVVSESWLRDRYPEVL